MIQRERIFAVRASPVPAGKGHDCANPFLSEVAHNRFVIESSQDREVATSVWPNGRRNIAKALI
jgi:hypothetical protein